MINGGEHCESVLIVIDYWEREAESGRQQSHLRLKCASELPERKGHLNSSHLELLPSGPCTRISQLIEWLQFTNKTTLGSQGYLVDVALKGKNLLC